MLELSSELFYSFPRMFYIWAEGLTCFPSQTYLIVINPPPTHLTSHLVSLQKHSQLYSVTSRLFAMIKEQYTFFFNFLKTINMLQTYNDAPLESFSKEGQFLRHIRSPLHLQVFCQIFRVSCCDAASVVVFHVFKYFSLLISFNLSRCII